MADVTQRLEIVTPEKKAFSDEISILIAPGVEGELGILPRHAALITPLKIGLLKFDHNGERIIMTISGGFMEVRDSRITILATAVERLEEIDVARAEAAKQRAEERLTAKTPDIDVIRAELALKRAINRLKSKQQI
ncbi:MAG: F0F1 ATP synthase subunit epsilon [Desulfotomaculaceae bacterium]|nr:F0F1 ATP synthase subunit epsilon [Desulfotomaculaceae bacterium]